MCVNLQLLSLSISHSIFDTGKSFACLLLLRCSVCCAVTCFWPPLSFYMACIWWNRSSKHLYYVDRRVCVYRAIDDDDYTVSPVSTPFVPVYDELVSISSFSIALIDRYMTNLSDTRYHQRGRENSTKSAIDIRPKYRFNYRQKADLNISIVVVAFLACATETISFVAHNHIGCLHSFMLR